MEIKTLLSHFAQLTLFAVMLSMGLNLRFRGVVALARQPVLLLRSLLAAFVLVPLAAIAVVKLPGLSFDVRAGIALMAIAPGAPMIYHKMLKGPADSTLAGSFQITMALLSVALVPLWIAILSALSPADAWVEPQTIAKQVFSAQLIPILLGTSLCHWLPDLAEEFEAPLARISDGMLLVLIVLILAIALPKVLTAGIPTVIAVVLMATAALLAGHWAGGPDPRTRLAIAVANATRNAGLALMLAAINFPNQEAMLSIIATYALISAVAGKVYTKQCQQRLPLLQEPQETAQV
jgi:BASS family bile acid:Na+ symporter